MIHAGDIHLADLHEEVRRRVLVLSNVRFNTVANRVLVAPEILGPPDPVPFPWRIDVDGATFAIDLARNLPIGRLLERIDRAPAAAMTNARRALLNIT